MKEEYKCIALSTEHMRADDIILLEDLITSKTTQMALQRDTGFFIKLYEEPEYIEGEFNALSDELILMLNWCHSEGYRLVEIDIDAPITDYLPTYFMHAQEQGVQGAQYAQNCTSSSTNSLYRGSQSV